MIPQFSQLFIYSPDKSRSICKTFILTPALDKEQALGKLFGIIEIESPDRALWDTIEHLSLEIERFYYGEKNIQLEPGKPSRAISVEETFEQTIQFINNKLIDLIKGGKLASLVEKINIIIGVLKRDQIYLTQVGNTKAFLCHHLSSNEYRMIDILTNSGHSGEDKVNPFKILANIINGKMSPNDTILICNSSLLDYLSLDKIKQTLTTMEPANASRHLKDLLLEASINTVFAAIVVKLSPQTAEPGVRNEIKLPQKSLENLITTEKTTEQYLSAPWKFKTKKYSTTVLRSTKKLADYLWRLTNAQINKALTPKPKPRSLPPTKIERPIEDIEEPITTTTTEITELEIIDEELIEPTQPSQQPIIESIKVQPTKILQSKNDWQKILRLFYLLTKRTVLALGRGLKHLTLWLINLIKNLWLIITNKGNQRQDTLNQLYTDFIHWLAKYLKKIRLLPRLSQVLLIICLLLVIIFIYSLSTLGRSKEQEAALNDYNQSISQIQQKKDEAEAALIYKDESRARELLNTASELINALPKGNKKQQQTADDLAQSLETSFAKLRHVYQIDQPELLTDLAQNQINANTLILANNQLYTFNTANNNIWQVNPASKEAKNLNTATSAPAFILAINQKNQNLLFYHQGNGLVKLDLKKTLENQTLAGVDVDFNGLENKIKDLGFYNSWLYLLAPDNNQIYRYSPTLAGFGQPVNWLKGEHDIKDAISFAVDGSIYVLKNNGQIQKFVAGQLQDYQITGLDPELNLPNKLWADVDSPNLYILDSVNKRLVVINKDQAKLVAQYTSQNFDALKDFAINEKGKKIYLLNGTKIYVIPFQH